MNEDNDAERCRLIAAGFLWCRCFGIWGWRNQRGDWTQSTETALRWLNEQESSTESPKGEHDQ